MKFVLILGLAAGVATIAFCHFFSKKKEASLLAATHIPPADDVSGQAAHHEPSAVSRQSSAPEVSGQAVTRPPSAVGRINGLTMVAPWEPFKSDPMAEVKMVAANWIAVVPYAFTPPGKGRVIYNENGRQWWGERPEGIAETIRLAHAAGIKTMLKPQVWIHGKWTGELDFDDEKMCAEWEADYEKYILGNAQLAENQGVELFCIGTEFRAHIKKRPQFWSGLIEKTRAIFHGKLTYSANWDDWQDVPFWEKLDFIGLGGYFPLVDEKAPTVERLVEAWQPILEKLKAFSAAQGRPILFTEYGYLTVDGCSWKNWELENGISSRPINQAAQANAINALHTVFQKEDWWAGSFLWKWFPNGMGHEGYPERDYTPQGKAAEAVLKKWFSEN